ncbi:hypothetical protein DM860_006635 [Cuscuta australis]|uniref:MADS-box domain-containing protein n=1 Tax=Cuscuta australis TaxID=267555 RepID=A0A328D4C1_9ASTE|nr:hypothetical protein DM860_006635 [Cuscuta australis]
MGRVKLEIKKIENTTNRQVTYSKRRNGLIKKAYELSVLCEIDVALIMFSPSGKPSVFSSNNKSIEDIIVRYVNLPKQERGRLQNQEFLQRALAKLKYESSDLNSHAASPMNSADHQLEEIQQQLAKCKSRLEQVEQRLRVYECDPCEITTFGEAQYRERIFEHNLNQVRQRRRFLEENCSDPIRRAHSASVGGMVMNGGDGQHHQFGSTDGIIPNGVIENWLLPVPGDDRADSQSQIFNFLDSNALWDRVRLFGIKRDGRGGGSVDGMGMTMMMMPQLHHMQNGDELLLGGGGGDPNHVIGGSTSSGGGRIPRVDDAHWTPPQHYAPPQPQPGVDDDVSLFPSTTYQRERAILEAFISQLTTPPLTQPDDLI